VKTVVEILSGLDQDLPLLVADDNGDYSEPTRIEIVTTVDGQQYVVIY